MFSAGSLIAGYRVERVLGTGGMGAVYLVANPELPRREALKLLSTELSRDEGFRARFIREADVASRLEHPNIVPIYRRGQTEDGQLWIAMQFIDGTDADEALRTGKMTPERAVRIVGEVANALDYAHRHNVIHRDVKPANFLLSGRLGPDERVLLGDFGIARAFDDASLTGTGEVMATVAYAAPEVLAGDPVGPRADQYSLGCALFRMLTGAAPFAGAGAQAAVMMAHLTKPPPRVSAHAPRLPSALDTVIATAMAKDPVHRFRTCAEFAAAAAAALHGSGDRTAPTHRIAPSPPPGPVHQDTLPAFHAPLPAPPPQQPSAAPRRRRRTAILAAAAGVVVVGAVAITAVAGPFDKSKPAAPSTTASATTTTSAPSATVAASVLSDLLLSTDVLSAIMDAPLQGDPIGDAIVDGRKSISEKDCVGAFGPVQAAAYADSGWTAIRTQWAGQRAAPEQDSTTVIQGVVAVPTPEDASYLFMNQSNQWGKCIDRPFVWDRTNWTFGQVNHLSSDTVTLTMALVGGTLSCGRALVMRKNVLVDVKACRPGEVTTQASDIAAKIADKIRGS